MTTTTTTTTSEERRQFAEAVCVLFDDVNPIGQSKVLQFIGQGNVPIEDAVAGLIATNREDVGDILRDVVVAIRDNKVSDLAIKENRPQPDESKPEAATVTTTPNRSITPAQGKSKRQAMQDMMEQMQQAMSQDDEEVESITNRIIEERFKPMLVDALSNGCFPTERIQEMIDATPPKTDDTKMRVMIDESFRSGVGKVIAQDVKAGNAVVLPPMHPVDPMFVDNKLSHSIEYHYHMGQHIYVDGPSGAGKTYPIEQVLRKLGKRYVKVNFADGIRLSDLTTKQEIIVENGSTQTKYIDGILPFCMRHGLALIGDEVDQLQPETTSIFNPATDKYPGELLLPGSGERVVAQPGFWVAFTGNCLTDETGLYSGYKSSNALTNRCAALNATYLQKDEEQTILEKDGLDPAEARMIVSVMNVLRDLYLNRGSVSQAPSTRQAVRISRYIQGKDVHGNPTPNLKSVPRGDAGHYTYFNFLPKSEYAEALRECQREDSAIKKTL